MRSGRLKNFCELCRKQCRDENGFHCHLNSASHHTRVKQFANNPAEHIEKYSKELEWKFVQMLKTKYPGEPKYLEALYEEYAEEKRHVKLNQTQWRNVTQFGEHLKSVRNIQVIGNPPDCKVVYLVNNTSEFIERSKREKKQATKEKEKEQMQKTIAKRMDREKELEQKRLVDLDEQLRREELERQAMDVPDRLELLIGFNEGNKRAASNEIGLQKEIVDEPLYKKKCEKIEALYQSMLQSEKVQRGHDEEDDVEWVCPNIIVKIKPHQIDEVFHHKKCKVVQLIEPYIAKVTIGTAIVQIDQTHLETVIPKPGHRVMALHGQMKGKIGILQELKVEEGFGVILIEGVMLRLSFNYFSKVAEDTQ